MRDRDTLTARGLDLNETKHEVENHEDEPTLTHRDFAELATKLHSSSVRRASLLSAVFAATFFIFGFPSYIFIHAFKPDLTLWNNLWPRLLINVAPFLVLTWILRIKRLAPEFRLWIWILSFPMILLGAESVHVWDLLSRGHSDLYFYVHAAEIYVIALAFIVTAPSPRFLAAMALSQIIFFWIPMGMLLYRHDSGHVFLLYLFDTIMNCLFTTATAFLVHRLHKALAVHNLKNKKSVKRFVGSVVTAAIFDGKKELLQPRQAKGFLLTTDIRGFTNLVQKTDKSRSQAFLKAYHSLVSEIVSRNGGFLNKTTGDGHLVSFGIMNVKKNKLELKGDENSLRMYRESLLERALSAASEISEGLARLASEIKIDVPVRLGAAIDFGEVTLAVIGHKGSRVELDLMGETVIRCTRLENHTKILRNQLSHPHSYLILSKEAGKYLKPGENFQVVSTSGHPVRDYPDIDFIFYRNLSARDEDEETKTA